MDAETFNKRELEQGRLSWAQLAVICGHTDVEQLKKLVKNGVLHWADIAKAVTVFQIRCTLSPDGKAGADTRARIIVPPPTVSEVMAAPRGKWPKFDGPAIRQPRNTREVIQMFGDPGTKTENPVWRKNNIVECHGKNRLPGVPDRFYVQVHRVIEPYLREALRRCEVDCPDYVIERLGGYCWRPQRGIPGNPLSKHSWGLAVDINPEHNKAISFKRGKAPKAWSEEYKKLWPRGVPVQLVNAFQSCGFAWGSDWDEDGQTHDETFLDPMHFEWIARDGKSIDV